MSDTVIRVENLSKQYRLGLVGTGTLSHDLNRWWSHIRGKEDPYLKVTEVNDRTRARGSTTENTEGHRTNNKQPITNNQSQSDYVWALQDINLEVKQGEVLGIIGRNGAGKSTLLKILSRITAPTTGEVRIKGRTASLLEVGTGFHKELTGRENIYLNGAIMGMTKAEVRGKLDEIVDFSGCERYIDTPVKRYSSGMMVRLGFAVAAHLEPEILIVDEVLAVGDAEFQKKCLGKMKDVAGHGRTVLFVSHNMGAIVQLCQSSLHLNSGLLSDMGRVDSVVERYIMNIEEQTQCRWCVDEEPDMPLQVQEVYSANSEGEARSLFDISDQIILVIRHCCRKELVASVVLVSLFRNGVELLHVFDTDVHCDRLTRRPVGVYTDEIRLPIRLIKAGSITISVTTALLNKSTTFQNADDVISFRIEETKEDTSFKGYAANRRGILMVTPTWKNTDFRTDAYEGNQES